LQKRRIELTDESQRPMTKPLKILKTREEIQARVDEMGRTLTEKFRGKEPLCVAILNGSFVFFSDLIRAIDLDLTCEFLGVSSYGDKMVSSGEVKVTLDLSYPIEGRDVILIEDLVDSGLTMNYLVGLMKARRPRSLTTVALLLKPKALKEPCPVDLVGFEIGNEFVVGYGIDYAGDYRNLPHIACLPNQ
jgi:hypoxanthine phosphoribosyltransferase